MSDESKSTESTQSESKSELSNLKAEMDRKLGNTEAQLNELKQTNQQLLAQLQTMSQPQAPKSSERSEDLSQLIYDDPQRYAEIVEARAEEKIMKKVEAQQIASQRQQGVLSQLVSDFPELSDANNELTKKAVEIHSSMPADERSNPISYKAAVAQAALELDVKPRSKRSASSDDSFTVSSGSGTKSRRREEGNDDAVLKIAQAFGMDVQNEKVQERLKKRAQRTNWTKYQ